MKPSLASRCFIELAPPQRPPIRLLPACTLMARGKRSLEPDAYAIEAAMAAALAIYRASGSRGGEVNETVSSEPLFH